MPRFNRNFAALLCGISLFAAAPRPTFAQDAKPETKPDAAPVAKSADADAPATWTLKFKSGAVRQYRVVAKLNGETGMGPLSIVLDTVQKRQITKIEDSGNVSWIGSPVSRKITFNDNEIPDNGDGKTSTLTVINKNGVVVDQNSTEATQGGDTLQRLGVVITSTPIPPKPVKIGDNWTVEYGGKLLKGVKFNVVYTYLGRETVFGRNTYKIQAKGDLPINASPKDLAKMTGTLNLDPDTGDSVRAGFKVDNLDLATPGGSALKVSLDSMATAILAGVNDGDLPKKETGK